MHIQVERSIESIVKTYTYIYTFAFVLLGPLLSFALSVRIFFALLGDVDTFKAVGVRAESVFSREKQLQAIVESEIKKNSFSSGHIHMIVKNGTFEYKNSEVLLSVNNLLTYKGLVVPRIAVIDTKAFLQEKKFFSQPSYDVRELDRYMRNVVFGSTNFSLPSQDNHQKPSLLPIPGFSIRTYFSLDCLRNGKMGSSLCDHYLKSFLQNMHVYDLSQDYEGVGFVFEKIKNNSSYQGLFCKRLQKYILYTYDVNWKLASIADTCGKEVSKTYDLLRSFFLVQEDLSKQTPSPVVFRDRNVNAYKLLSIQQQIFLEISKKKLNQPRIALYLQYVEELLKRDAIDHVYKDEIFLFNNSYLSNALSSPTFATSLSRKEEIRLLQQRIADINKGSELKGYIGLEKQVFNKKLLLLLDTNNASSEKELVTTDADFSLLDIFTARFSFPALRILEQEERDGTKIFVSGKLLFGKEHEVHYPVTILFSYYLGNFIVEDIVFVENTGRINQLLRSIVEKNKLTLPQIYDYLKENMEIFSSDPIEITLCDKIKSLLPSVQRCNEEQIDVEVVTKSGSVLYSFLHTGGKVLGLYLTDKERERDVWSVFSGIQTNEVNIASYIKEVISYEPPVKAQEDSTDLSQAERLAIKDRFSTYLNASSLKIFKKDTEVLVAFTVKGIDFVCTYDIPTFTIKKLFFRKLGPSQGFFSFNMILDAKNIDILEQFTKDPLAYLEKIDPKLVLLYKKS